jgi:hypothetical protein
LVRWRAEQQMTLLLHIVVIQGARVSNQADSLSFIKPLKSCPLLDCLERLATNDIIAACCCHPRSQGRQSMALTTSKLPVLFAIQFTNVQNVYIDCLINYYLVFNYQSTKQLTNGQSW